MIKSTKPVSLGEVKEIIAQFPQEEENKKAKALLTYIKKFVKAKPEKIKALKEKLERLDIAKLKPRHIAKIVELMPEDPEDLRKIFVGEEVVLEQDEISSILEKVKEK